MPPPIMNKPIGWLLAATTMLVVMAEWSGVAAIWRCVDILTVPLLLLLASQVSWKRRIFFAIGLALVAAALLSRSDWLEITEAALHSAAVIVAFFSALATLRFAAASSPAIQTCGRFLAQQKPGRRYAALTVGGQLFGILLNYGALGLLGSLAEANARLEANAEIRSHRIRRMLLAIQRGFVSTLPWSPLAFAMAISTSLVPGATWADAVAPCLGSGLILAGVGWALDTIFKPRLSVPAQPRTNPDGTWLSLWPLLALLGILIASVGAFQMLSGVRTIGVVMLVVPILSLIWLAVQNSDDRPLRSMMGRAVSYVSNDLPNYRSEIVLLMMAGFIGTLGSRLLSPMIAASGIDLSAIPGWQILVAIVWIIPLTGQIGMNPILSVTLLTPLLPTAAAMGVSPADVIVAITAGWALGGASSPFTATTMLIGSLGGVSAFHVGLRWNGAYVLICGVALSLWVALIALL